MSATHRYDYAIERGASASDLERFAKEVKFFLLFYDDEARAEKDGRSKLRIVTKIGNADIVDSAVRVCSLRWHLLASRIGNERPPKESSLLLAPGARLLSALRRMFH